MGKIILVTGGAGFIGSHLCKRLLDEGNEVICLDNFFTGQRSNLHSMQDNPKFTLIEQDVTEPIRLNHVHQIYNLACPASPVHYQFDPIKTIDTSYMGARHVLQLALKTGATVLQASTSEVYGDPDVHPQPEAYRGSVNPIGIRSCYDEGKRAAETLFFDYHRQHGVDIRVVRIFNTYGPNMRADDGRVVSNFIVQALQNKDITIYGDGSQTRSFQYVDDLVEGMHRMMNQQGFHGPVNIGNEGEFTINELAELVQELLPSSLSQFIHHPLPMDDPRQRKPDITLARKELGWSAQVALRDGLRKTIDYFREIEVERTAPSRQFHLVS